VKDAIFIRNKQTSDCPVEVHRQCLIIHLAKVGLCRRQHTTLGCEEVKAMDLECFEYATDDRS